MPSAESSVAASPSSLLAGVFYARVETLPLSEDLNAYFALGSGAAAPQWGTSGMSVGADITPQRLKEVLAAPTANVDAFFQSPIAERRTVTSVVASPISSSGAMAGMGGGRRASSVASPTLPSPSTKFIVKTEDGAGGFLVSSPTNDGGAAKALLEEMALEATALAASPLNTNARNRGRSSSRASSVADGSPLAMGSPKIASPPTGGGSSGRNGNRRSGRGGDGDGFASISRAHTPAADPFAESFEAAESEHRALTQSRAGSMASPLAAGYGAEVGTATETADPMVVDSNTTAPGSGNATDELEADWEREQREEAESARRAASALRMLGDDHNDEASMMGPPPTLSSQPGSGRAFSVNGSGRLRSATPSHNHHRQPQQHTTTVTTTKLVIVGTRPSEPIVPYYKGTGMRRDAVDKDLQTIGARRERTYAMPTLPNLVEPHSRPYWHVPPSVSTVILANNKIILPPALMAAAGGGPSSSTAVSAAAAVPKETDTLDSIRRKRLAAKKREREEKEKGGIHSPCEGAVITDSTAHTVNTETAESVAVADRADEEAEERERRVDEAERLSKIIPIVGDVYLRGTLRRANVVAIADEVVRTIRQQHQQQHAAHDVPSEQQLELLFHPQPLEGCVVTYYGGDVEQEAALSLGIPDPTPQGAHQDETDDDPTAQQRLAAANGADSKGGLMLSGVPSSLKPAKKAPAVGSKAGDIISGGGTGGKKLLSAAAIRKAKEEEDARLKLEAERLLRKHRQSLCAAKALQLREAHGRTAYNVAISTFYYGGHFVKCEAVEEQILREMMVEEGEVEEDAAHIHTTSNSVNTMDDGIETIADLQRGAPPSSSPDSSLGGAAQPPPPITPSPTVLITTDAVGSSMGQRIGDWAALVMRLAFGEQQRHDDEDEEDGDAHEDFRERSKHSKAKKKKTSGKKKQQQRRAPPATTDELFAASLTAAESSTSATEEGQPSSPPPLPSSVSSIIELSVLAQWQHYLWEEALYQTRRLEKSTATAKADASASPLLVTVSDAVPMPPIILNTKTLQQCIALGLNPSQCPLRYGGGMYSTSPSADSATAMTGCERDPFYNATNSGAQPNSSSDSIGGGSPIKGPRGSGNGSGLLTEEDNSNTMPAAVRSALLRDYAIKGNAVDVRGIIGVLKAALEVFGAKIGGGRGHDDDAPPSIAAEDEAPVVVASDSVEYPAGTENASVVVVQGDGTPTPSHRPHADNGAAPLSSEATLLPRRAGATPDADGRTPLASDRYFCFIEEQSDDDCAGGAHSNGNGEEGESALAAKEGIAGSTTTSPSSSYRVRYSGHSPNRARPEAATVIFSPLPLSAAGSAATSPAASFAAPPPLAEAHVAAQSATITTPTADSLLGRAVDGNARELFAVTSSSAGVSGVPATAALLLPVPVGAEGSVMADAEARVKRHRSEKRSHAAADLADNRRITFSQSAEVEHDSDAQPEA